MQKKKHTKKREREKEVKKQLLILGFCILMGLFCLLMVFKYIWKPDFMKKYINSMKSTTEINQVPLPQLDVQLLTVNEFSRPGYPTDTITGVVVHYTANPGSTAQDNRDYFEGLKDTQETKVSSNFIVGLDGEIIQCVPTAEMAYASNSRNIDTVSIECCHPDETGKFNDATYKSLVELVAFLCGKFNLSVDDVIRHYDITGKNCPKYYVENEEEWKQFKADVADYIEKNGI